MLKRTITYENSFTNERITEEHYFHINKANIVEMEMEEHNLVYRAKNGEEHTGPRARLMKIMDSEDGKAIMAEIKEFIRRSYGKRVGDKHLKSDAIWEEFSSSEAYSQLIFDLCTDAEMASSFINGIWPSNMEQIAAEVKAKAEKLELAQQNDDVPSVSTPEDEPVAPLSRVELIQKATPENPVVLTHAEIVEMDEPIFKSGLSDGRYKLS